MKYRKALLDDEVSEIIQQTAVGISERYAIEMEAIGCDKDHIHLLCEAHPKVAPSKIVQIFKSITAREIFSRKPSIKKELWGVRFGQMDIMFPQSVKEAIGIQLRSMSKNKVNPKLNSNNSKCLNKA